MHNNKKIILNVFKSDYSSSIDYHNKWRSRRGAWIQEENGEPYGNEEKGKSQIVSRDIKKVNAYQHAAIIDPFVSTPNLIDASPITEEDRPTAEQSSELLNYQFCRDFNRYNFISESYKVQQREGTVIVKVAWESEEGEVEVQVPVTQLQMVQTPQGIMQQEVPTGEMRTEIQTKLIVNRPTAEVCDNVALYVDPTTVGSIENAQFVIHKYMSNMSKLKESGLYENLDSIVQQTSSPYTGEYDDYEKRDTSQFAFSDEPRKELEVFEYWGNYDLNDDGIAEAIVCVWVGDTIIRLEENPYPDKKIPFISCPYDNEPFNINGRANADVIGIDQKMKTAISRAMNNTLDSGTHGQKGYPKGMLDPIQAKRFKEGKDFEFNTGEAANIWVGKFADIPTSTMNYYDSISRNIETLSGVMTGAQQSGAALGSANKSSSGILSAAAKREIDISRNFKENLLVPLFRKWHSMNQEFLEDEQIIRITNDEFVTIRRDDLYGNIDIEISVSTPASDMEKAGDLSFMLQTMGQTLPFEMTQMILAEIAKLKKMPDLSKRIETYQPQPDPYVEEMKMLEMEKLKSEIEERRGRTMEKQSDMTLKDAKTQNELAKSRGVHSKADLDDQDFLDKQSGNDIRKQMDVQNNKDMNQGVLNGQKSNS